jgi:flagellin
VNAAVTDSLGLATAATTITVSYLTVGAGGSAITSTANITCGVGTSYNNTVQGMINAINNSGLGLNASFSTATLAGTNAIALGAGTDTGIVISGQSVGLGKNVGVVASIPSNAPGDTLNGTLTIGSNPAINLTTGAPGGTAYTTGSLEAYINSNNFGVTASVDAVTGDLDLLSANSTLVVTSAGLTVNGGAPTAVTTPSSSGIPYYNSGLTGNITDTTTGATNTVAGVLNSIAAEDVDGTGSTATISYTDGAGQNLSGTDLLSQTNAQTALTALATAITDVAAMDGYIGAQINTLNSVSQVMNTQQENVTSAQNAIQATDYASATAAMSKYEILSQTGIAALAQANTVQQEVTKLLQ